MLSSVLSVCWPWHFHLLVTQPRGTDPAKKKAYRKKGITAELWELVQEGSVGQWQDWRSSNLKSAWTAVNIQSQRIQRKSGLIYPSGKTRLINFLTIALNCCFKLVFHLLYFSPQCLPSLPHILYSPAILFLQLHDFEIVKNINCIFSIEVSPPFV